MDDRGTYCLRVVFQMICTGQSATRSNNASSICSCARCGPCVDETHTQWGVTHTAAITRRRVYGAYLCLYQRHRRCQVQTGHQERQLGVKHGGVQELALEGGSLKPAVMAAMTTDVHPPSQRREERLEVAVALSPWVLATCE